MTEDRRQPQEASAGAPENSLLSQPEEKVQRSLFGEILDWMLAPLLLLWPMSIAITYLVAKSIANQPFDRALEDKVLVLAQQVKEFDGQAITQLSKPARDILRADDLDHVHFQVKNARGEVIDGDADLPLPPDDDKTLSGNIQFRNLTLRGIDFRIAYSYVDVIRPTFNQPAGDNRLVLIQVAETLEKRAVLANEIIKGVVLPQFIILPIALALVWFALSRGLSPLAELQQRIRARRPDDLSPIDSRQVPEEITPLVNSLNDMLARLAQTIEIQKRFIADAAHQMKTPLAGMRMQSELALRQQDQEEIRRSLLQLSTSSEAATRLVNQLLALAKAENQTPATKPFEPVNLNELAMQVVRDWIPASFTKKIDLGFEQPEYAVTIFADPVMLREMLSNLVDNALRYTPSGHSVTVRVSVSVPQELALIEVEDNGPGIPEAEREHVFERFYRILGSNVQGSGLGLAIVREIVQKHGAQIDILDNPHPQDPQFPGCVFRIAFRLNPYDEFVNETA
ncbi:sensor histidine kinase [Undibacterium oligocarboniphilum]|uniref:histidine kinase n=1 Tax=Undibacterium oligocarboniphilum TaxID=666702 RepID=A0A850QDF0_9BURK|nr:sensor histidine kinase [Undibacterium oligocarboniphilum]MBC3870726.1 sensor histidine kinase N-terminal domain-containing protein [Undibacterium oligocarboniphilum]NVO78472.1 sensor histidine kinase N-terminal domain-containing protein [Undibacterium oligocarboniphilum]